MISPGSTASMTCAGLFGLAVGHGATLDIRKKKNPKLESTDVSKDDNISRGLQALATAVGKPAGWSGVGKAAVDIPKVSGKGFYYLWSLERVAVAYNLETISRKDWYQWGSEVLLASQMSDGSWAGEYGGSGVDTCFALLFLKRVNFAHDLSAGLSGGKRFSSKVLKSGGVGGSGLKNAGKGIEPMDIGSKSIAKSEETSRPPTTGTDTKAGERARPKPRTPEEEAAFRLTDELLKASGERRAKLMEEIRDAKGPEYTEALVNLIAQLDAADKKTAQNALADRLTRMKPATLRAYLKDEDVEIRRAAALAIAQKDVISLVPDLIALLNDREPLVERAAYTALKAMSGKDFGPSSGAERTVATRPSPPGKCGGKRRHANNGVNRIDLARAGQRFPSGDRRGNWKLTCYS